MNNQTRDLIAVLQNLKDSKPVFHSFISKDTGTYIKFKSKTSKITSIILDTFLYSINEVDYEKIDWVYINTEMKYKVNADHDIIY